MKSSAKEIDLVKTMEKCFFKRFQCPCIFLFFIFSLREHFSHVHDFRVFCTYYAGVKYHFFHRQAQKISSGRKISAPGVKFEQRA